MFGKTYISQTYNRHSDIFPVCTQFCCRYVLLGSQTQFQCVWGIVLGRGSYTNNVPEHSTQFWHYLDFPGAQTVKNLPARQETRVRSLGWKVPLEKGMAIHSSILAWRIPWTAEPGRLQSIGSQRVRHDRVTNTFTFTLSIANIWRNFRPRPSPLS